MATRNMIQNKRYCQQNCSRFSWKSFNEFVYSKHFLNFNFHSTLFFSLSLSSFALLCELCSLRRELNDAATLKLCALFVSSCRCCRGVLCAVVAQNIQLVYISSFFFFLFYFNDAKNVRPILARRLFSCILLLFCFSLLLSSVYFAWCENAFSWKIFIACS